MGEFITLTELVLILIICVPVWALGKTLIETINNKNK